MQGKSILYTTVVIASLMACNTNNQRQQDANIDTTVVEADTTSAVTDTSTFVATQDSIPLTLINGAATQKAIMEKGKHVVFSFDIPSPGKLQANVKPEEAKGNVRIAQIFMPDNAADGPFGMEMEYDLKQPGKYRLVVSENQMAGDPYNGPFTLSIKFD